MVFLHPENTVGLANKGGDLKKGHCRMQIVPDVPELGADVSFAPYLKIYVDMLNNQCVVHPHVKHNPLIVHSFSNGKPLKKEPRKE